MRFLSYAWLLMLAACGGRTLPTAGDGAGPGGGDAGVRQDSAARRDSGAVAGCRNNKDCLSTEYCHIEAGCVVTGARMGQCRPRPQGCDDWYKPACGCDGKTYSSSCEAHLVGVNIKHQGVCDPSCEKVSCHVHNDCCTCEATKFLYSPAPCPATCLQPKCDARGIRKPDAYCLSGHCLLANTFNGCTKDSDCYKVNDCCFCLALPKTVPHPACPADCFVGACTSKGLQKATPACVKGICRLVLP
jgi:hypothetical protein